MATHQPEFWFRGDYEVMIDAAAQLKVAQTYEHAAKTLHKFDRAKEPYGARIELVEHRSNRDASLAEFAQQMIEALAAPRKSTGGRACPLHWLMQVHATMNFVANEMGSRLVLHSNPEPPLQPAGSLLFDAKQPLITPVGTTPEVWEEAIQTTLPQHPLARAGAEYAVALDRSLPPNAPERADEIASSFEIVQQIARFLPTASDQHSVISEFWINYAANDEAEPVARLRVWRLGVMQVAPSTKRA